MSKGASIRLHQGQVWKQGDDYLRIVEWSRMEIVYKTMKDMTTREGSQHRVTKKEFCRMLKGATLLAPEEVPAKVEQEPNED